MATVAAGLFVFACKGATERFKGKDKPSNAKESASQPAVATDTAQSSSDLPAWARSIDLSFWKKSEFLPGASLTEVKADQIRAYFAQTEDYYANPPEANAEMELNICFLDMLRKLPVSVTERSVEVHASLDLTSCQLKAPLFKEYKTQIDLVHACENGNMTAWNGRTYGDLEKENQLCADGQSLTIWRNSQHWVATGKTEKGAPYEATGSMLLGRADTNGLPCSSKILQGRVSDEDCNQWSIYSLKISSIDGSPVDRLVESTYIRNVFEGVESLTDGSPWPEKGTVSVDYNIWEGKVSYRAAKEAPTYEIKMLEGETLTGVVREPITPPTSSTLHLSNDLTVLGPIWSGLRSPLSIR